MGETGSLLGLDGPSQMRIDHHHSCRRSL